jgi:hypothetical protein
VSTIETYKRLLKVAAIVQLSFENQKRGDYAGDITISSGSKNTSKRQSQNSNSIK